MKRITGIIISAICIIGSMYVGDTQASTFNAPQWLSEQAVISGKASASVVSCNAPKSYYVPQIQTFINDTARIVSDETGYQYSEVEKMNAMALALKTFKLNCSGGDY